jgi:hypothetical protein
VDIEVDRPVVVVVVAGGRGGERNREVLLAVEIGLGRLFFGCLWIEISPPPEHEDKIYL